VRQNIRENTAASARAKCKVRSTRRNGAAARELERGSALLVEQFDAKALIGRLRSHAVVLLDQLRQRAPLQR
jgi:hypothetical protein